jgi:hypothetical protein
MVLASSRLTVTTPARWQVLDPGNSQAETRGNFLFQSPADFRRRRPNLFGSECDANHRGPLLQIESRAAGSTENGWVN